MSLPGHLVYGLNRGWQRWKHTRRWDTFIKEHPLGPDECGLIAHQGIGDHLITLAFTPAVRRFLGLNVRYVAGNPRYAFLADTFSQGPRYIPWRGDLFDFEKAKNLKSGLFFCTHFPELELQRVVGWKDFHFLDAYRCRLDLPSEAKPEWPRKPSRDEVAAAEAYLRDHSLHPGKTVLLAAEARTTTTEGVTAHFWTQLATGLRGRGLHPCFNIGPGTGPRSDFPALAVPLETLRAVATAAGHVCSVRSGLSDLVSNLNCRRAVVYSKSRSGSGSLLKGATFDRYDLSVSPPLEVEVAAGEETNVVNRLLCDWA